MKTRIDFVTNSSSSSFVVAIHNGTTYEELREIVETNRDEIEKIIEQYSDHVHSSESEEFNERVDNKDFAGAAEVAIDLIAERLDDETDGDFVIGDYSVGCFECDSESSDIVSFFLYMRPIETDSDKLKVGCF